MTHPSEFRIRRVETEQGPKSIAVLYLGGTIGSKKDSATGALSPQMGLPEILSHSNLSGTENVETYPLTVDHDRSEQLMLKDSTNINPEDWKLLRRKIEEIMPHVDGIIVLCGTDTMANIASAQAFLSAGTLDKPIVFTGSQLPIGEQNTDATQNVEGAFVTMRQMIIDGACEVVIVFDNKAFRAATTQKTSEESFDAFDSDPLMDPLYIITAKRARRVAPTRTREDVMETRKRLEALIGNDPVNDFRADTIISLDTFPGLARSLVAQVGAIPEVEVVLLKSFGTGNLPSDPNFEKTDLAKAIEEITAMGKIVLITSSFPGGNVDTTVYAAGLPGVAAGGVSLGGMTPIAAQTKLALLLAQPKLRGNKQALLKALTTDWVGETGTENQHATQNGPEPEYYI